MNNNDKTNNNKKSAIFIEPYLILYVAHELLVSYMGHNCISINSSGLLKSGYVIVCTCACNLDTRCIHYVMLIRGKREVDFDNGGGGEEAFFSLSSLTHSIIFVNRDAHNTHNVCVMFCN